jgi:hypothetical protein
VPIQLLDRPPVIVTRPQSRPDPDVAATVSDAASVIMWAAAGVLLLGSALDLALLWGVQRQPTPQWEFTALLSTAQLLPLFVMGLAFAGGALLLRGTATLAGYRLIAVATLLLGLVGAAIALRTGSEYISLSRVASAATEGPLRAVALKAIALSTIYLVVLTPLGIIGVRWPKKR